MSRHNQLSNYATTIAANNGKTQITYHSTVIVEYDDQTITLRTGGWMTVTTKRKMNQAARQFSLGYVVAQEDGDWYVARLDASGRYDRFSERRMDGDTITLNRVDYPYRG